MSDANAILELAPAGAVWALEFGSLSCRARLGIAVFGNVRRLAGWHRGESRLNRVSSMSSILELSAWAMLEDRSRSRLCGELRVEDVVFV